MSREEKANYGDALVYLAMNRPVFAGSQLSFGESRIKDRMSNTLNSRKPVLWVMVAVMVMMIAATIALLANPPSNVKDVPGTKKSLIDNVNTGSEIYAAQAIAID